MKNLPEIARIYVGNQFPNNNEKRLCSIRCFIEGFKMARVILKMDNQEASLKSLQQMAEEFADTNKFCECRNIDKNIIIQSFIDGFYEAMAILRHVVFFYAFPLKDEDSMTFVNPEN